MFLIIPVPSKKEELIQEYLYIEDTYYVPHEAPEKQKVDDDVERGVVIIDMF